MKTKWKLLKESDIPEWIRASPYLESLLENGPLPAEGLKVPKWCLKRDKKINCYQDVVEFVRTARYWLLPDETITESNDLFNFVILKMRHDHTPSILCLEKEYPLLNGLWRVQTAPDEMKVERAAEEGSICILKYLCEVLNLVVTDKAGSAAVWKGHLKCLEYLHSRGLKMSKGLLSEAVTHNSEQCLMYVHQHGASLDTLDLLSALCVSKKECLRYILQHEIKDFNVWWLRAHLETSTCDDLEVIGWIAKSLNFTVVHHYIYVGAARAGRLHVLKFCCEQNLMIGSAGAILGECARGGHLECLVYLLERGILCNDLTYRKAACGGDITCVRYLLDRHRPSGTQFCNILAKHGHYECLVHARSLGLEWDAGACKGASAFGSLPCLTFAHQNGCPWDVETCRAAARAGKLDCLQYAHENGCHWDESTCEAAARGGHLNCLRYAHENGCPWKRRGKSSKVDCEWISVSAARAPTAECLKYVVEKGAAVRKATAFHAARAKCLESLKFLHSVNCTWDDSVCTEAATAGSVDCLRFLHENGCPWGKWTGKTAAREVSVHDYSTGYVWDDDESAAREWDYESAAEWCRQRRLCREYLQLHNCPGIDGK